MSINESNIFEENDLFIEGRTLKNTFSTIREEFNQIYKETMENFPIYSENELIQELKTDDIYIKTLEEDVEEIIIENREKMSNKKKIFNLDKNKQNSFEEKKPNHLRSEAKILEDSLKGLELPTYQELKCKKFSNCGLFSYHFFKQFYKKEIGKENNYIFNFKDNFLNDMTKIDKEFFEDYFKFPDAKKGTHKNLTNFNGTEERELIYEFAIYHPFKNTKTGQIALTGSNKLYDLKDKIYCVLDEIHSNSSSSFFFIENTFYNDTRHDFKTLSNKISENKIRKLNLNSFSYMQEENYSMCKEDSDYKNYKKEFYSKGNFLPSEVYDEISMEDFTLDQIHFRLGYPYLYRHIDYCDHMVMLVDIKLSDFYDQFVKEEGRGLVTYQKKLKRRLCDGCNFYYAKFISINDKIGGETNKVIFFCEYCLKKLHQKEIKENSLSSLKLIPYYHD